MLAALHQEDLDRPPAAIFTTCDTIGMMKALDSCMKEARAPKVSGMLPAKICRMRLRASLLAHAMCGVM